MRLIIPGVALGLLLAVSACQKKQETPPPSDTSGQQPATTPDSGAPAGGTMSPDSGGTPPAGGGSGGHPFGLQSGRVEYQVTGADQGTEVLSWDSWGSRMSIQTKSSKGSSASDRTTLVSMDKVVTMDNTAKTGASMANPMKEVMMAGGSTDEMVGKMMTMMGAQKQGTDTVLGKTCEKYVSAAATTCVWQGIALKTEVTLNGAATTKVATKIDETAHIDPSIFQVPAGVSVKEVSGTTTGMSAPADNTAPAAPGGH
jgi:hypothetical protein